jgi:hypothetical protein
MYRWSALERQGFVGVMEEEETEMSASEGRVHEAANGWLFYKRHCRERNGFCFGESQQKLPPS